jgi:Lipid A 3-O-deacylase (PagL)
MSDRFLKSFLLRVQISVGLLICSGSFCAAQEVKPGSGFGIEMNGIAGKVIKHEAKFTLPLPALTTGLDLNLVWRSYGKRDWEQRRGYPIIGIGAAYINYGIDSVYGRCFAVYPSITVALISGKHLEWSLRLGEGVGYVTREYQRTAPVDTINKAIGSKINGFSMVMTDLRYHINKHWDLQAGANITHISNTSFRKPNLGINLIGGHIGVRYSPLTSSPARIKRDLIPLKNRWLAQVRLSMSYVSSYTPGGPIYPIYIASGYVSKRWWSKNKFFAGADYSYHANIYAYLRNNELLVGKEAQNSYKAALFAGNEFLLGRIGIVVQAGYYLKESAVKQEPVYEKIGAHYYIVQREFGPIKEMFLSAFVKTHLSVAEFGEFGVGFGF